MENGEQDQHVLTLEEAASLLRVSEDLVRSNAEQGRLPGQLIGDQWRFLKSAILEWLGGSKGYKERIMTHAGSWANDDAWREVIKKIYADRRKGRKKSKSAKG